MKNFVVKTSIVAIVAGCGPVDNGQLNALTEQPLTKPSAQLPNLNGEEEATLGLGSSTTVQQLDGYGLPEESWDRHVSALSRSTTSFPGRPKDYCPNYDIDGNGAINIIARLEQGKTVKWSYGNQAYEGDGAILAIYILRKTVGLSTNDYDFSQHKAARSPATKQDISDYLDCLEKHPDKPLDMNRDGRLTLSDAIGMLRLSHNDQPLWRNHSETKKIQRFKTVCYGVFRTEQFRPSDWDRNRPARTNKVQVSCNEKLDPYVRLPDLKTGNCDSTQERPDSYSGEVCSAWNQVKDGKTVYSWYYRLTL